MRIVTRRWAQAGLLLAVAAIGFALTVWAIAVASPGEQQDPGGGGTFDFSRFMTTERDRLAICVQAVELPSIVESQVKASIETALTEIASNPLWTTRDFSNPPPVVDEGCPVGPAVFDDLAGPVYGNQLTEVLGRAVIDASYYLVFVYVLPQDKISQIAGTSLYRLAREEIICEVEVCRPVTTGLYLGADELLNDELLRSNLENAIGLK